MYPYFIEVHPKSCDTESGYIDSGMSINVDHIIEIGDRFINTTDSRIPVRETYEELLSLVKGIGCLIQKADPRIDTTRPLTMYDLCKAEMIGEPVWNSNTIAWMLLIDSALDSRSWVDLIDNGGKTHRYAPIDVDRYPLYRMKKNAG